MSKVRIVSDGTQQGTKVFAGDVPLDFVTKIEILEINAENVVEARITFALPELDITAELVDG